MRGLQNTGKRGQAWIEDGALLQYIVFPGQNFISILITTFFNRVVLAWRLWGAQKFLERQTRKRLNYYLDCFKLIILQYVLYCRLTFRHTLEIQENIVILFSRNLSLLSCLKRYYLNSSHILRLVPSYFCELRTESIIFRKNEYSEINLFQACRVIWT